MRKSICSNCMNRVEYCLCVDDDYDVNLPETRERTATLQRQLSQVTAERDKMAKLLRLAIPHLRDMAVDFQLEKAIEKALAPSSRR